MEVGDLVYYVSDNKIKESYIEKIVTTQEYNSFGFTENLSAITVCKNVNMLENEVFKTINELFENLKKTIKTYNYESKN